MIVREPGAQVNSDWDCCMEWVTLSECVPGSSAHVRCVELCISMISLPLCSVTLVQKYYTECLNTSCDIVSLVNKERSRPERKRRSHLVSSAGLLIWVFRLLFRLIIIQISTIDRLAIKSIGQWIEIPIYVVFNLMRLNRWYPFQKDRATPFSEHLWFVFNRLLRSTLYSNGGDHKQNITDYVKQVQINIL